MLPIAPETSSGTKRTQSDDTVSVHTPKKVKTNPAVDILCTGPHWRGEESFEHIIVFGDSYSSSSGDTWIEHIEARQQRRNKPVRVDNFAFPGATAESDFSDQVKRVLALHSTSASPGNSTASASEKTAYIVFIGINDCCNSDVEDLEDIMEEVFDGVHDLYVKGGARSFVFVDVPPVDRSPQVVSAGASDEVKERVEAWNDLLRVKAEEFGTSTSESTVLLFSSHQTLSGVLDDPTKFDLSEDDPDAEGGGVWVDDLHLTEDVHAILAERMAESFFSA